MGACIFLNESLIWTWPGVGLLGHMVVLFFFFKGLHPHHMKVPRLGVKSELQLPAYATATAMWDPSCVCNLYHSSQQCWILNPLSDTRDPTHILMDPSWVRPPLSHKGNSLFSWFHEVRIVLPHCRRGKSLMDVTWFPRSEIGSRPENSEYTFPYLCMWTI